MTSETISSKVPAEVHTDSAPDVSPVVTSKENKFITDQATSEEFADEFEGIVAQNDEVSHAVEQSDDKPEKSRIKSIRNKLGYFAARAYYGSMDKLGGGFRKLSDLQDRHQKRNEARYEKNTAAIGDSRLVLTRKFLGRNATKIATGGLFAVGVGVTAAVVAAKIRYGIEGGGSASAHDTIQNHNINFAAKSDVLVRTDGRGHPDGASLQWMTDKYGETGAKTVNVQYPAEIATPFTPGDKNTLEQSSQIAEQQQYATYLANKGKSIHYFGYSEGGVSTINTLKRIADENGGVLPDNVKATIVGSPAVPGGIGDNAYAKALDPLLKQFGIDITGDGPKSNGGIRYVTNESDIWGAGGSSSPIDLADKAIGTAFGGTHGYGHNAPSTTELNPDGSTTTTIHGGPAVVDGYRVRSGIGNALAQNQGVKVTREMDEAILAIRGDKNGNYNVADITEKLARLADQQQPGSGQAVRTILPNILPQELANAVTEIQNKVPDVAAQVLNPGSTSTSNGNVLPDIATTPIATTPIQEIAPAVTTPAISQVPVQVQQPIQQLVEQATPLVNQVTEQVQKVAPQLAPQLQQGRDLLGQFGIK